MPKVKMPGAAAIEARPLSGSAAGSKYRFLLSRLLMGTAADHAALGLEGEILLVESRRTHRGAAMFASDELPPPPSRARLITDTGGGGAWPRWCRERLLTSAAVAPVMDGTRRVGTVVLARTNGNRLTRVDLSVVVLTAWMAGNIYEADRRLIDLRRELGQFEPALQLWIGAGAGRGRRAGFRELARAMGPSVDATYCRLASRDANGGIRIHAAAGWRADSGSRTRRLTMRRMPRCAEAMRTGRPAVLHFEGASKEDLVERDLLFSPTTKTGVILPFAAEDGVEGVLLIGEERERSRNRLTERLTALDLVAQRLGPLVSMAQVMERRQVERLKRQTRIVEIQERRQLARELHDDVGQALTVLLLQLRFAIQEDGSNSADLRMVESAAQSALAAARALAYEMRHRSDHDDPIDSARIYAEMMLASAHVELSWLDTRVDRRLPHRAAQEVGRTLREAVLNVVRHARASKVEVHVRNDDNGFLATIADDGVGLPAGQAQLSENDLGLGLTASAEGISRVGGTLEVSRFAAGGTMVRLSVALK